MKMTYLAALALAGLVTAPEARAGVDVGIGIFLGATDRWGYPDTYRRGFDRGLREGAEHGYRDGRRDRGFSFWHASEYRHGAEGYRSWMGPRRDYVAGFRLGYEKGYRRGFASGHDDRHRRHWDDDHRVIYEEPYGRYPRRW